MKKSMRLLVASGVLASASLLTANAEKAVEITDPEGGVEKIPLNLNTRLAFGQTGIDISNDGEASVSIPYLKIQSISFGDLSRVGEIHSATIGLRQNPVGNMLQVTGQDSKSAVLGITSMDGKTMLLIKDWHGEDIDVAALHPGIYLLSINNNTIKFIKK